jgi:hypothetical protein
MVLSIRPASPCCNCAGFFGWFRGGECLRFALGFVAPCITIEHGLLPPCFGRALWHTRQWAPAQPPFCGLACRQCGGFHSHVVAAVVLNGLL